MHVRFSKRAGRSDAGFSVRVSSAVYQTGVPELVIMRTTGHRSVTTLRKYIRKGELFVVNGASKLGL